MDPDGEVDDLAPHVVLHSLGSPVVIGQRSPGAEVGHVALGEDVEPLVESGQVTLPNIQPLGHISQTIFQREPDIVAVKQKKNRGHSHKQITQCYKGIIVK